MQINMTLVVQALNFIFAYIALNNLLLKPAFEALEHDEKSAAELLATVISRRATIDAIERHQQERWNMCKQQIAQTIPQVDTYQELRVSEKEIDLSSMKVSSAHEKKLVQQVSQYFVNTIQDAL